MFENFCDITAQYTAPRLDTEGRFGAEIVSIEDNPGDNSVPVKGKIALLASPSFAGLKGGMGEHFQKRLSELMAALPDDRRQELVEQLLEVTGHLDISAIGNSQLEALRGLGGREPHETIRIAVLHHHLLPDDQLEVAPFEAVVDAGRTLEVLLGSGFDLVLSGHKHNRRLARYVSSGRAIDVYSSPSLFSRTTRTNPGFTVIDIVGNAGSRYATLQHFSTDRIECTESSNLYRQDALDAELVRVCSALGTDVQRERIQPLLVSIGQALRWQDPQSEFAETFSNAWKQVKHELDVMAAEKLVFRAPDLEGRWADLIGSIRKCKGGTGDFPELCLVSHDDLAYWERAQADPDSQAALYSRALNDYPQGSKTRLIILDSADLRDKESQTRVWDVLKWMESKGFRTWAVSAEHGYTRGWDDFGLLGDYVVSRFTQRRNELRELQEEFNKATIEEARRNWSLLAQQGEVWRSSQAFAEYHRLNSSL